MADRADLMLLQYMNNLPEQRRLEFQVAYQSRRKERGTALLFSLFLGSFGADRFYLGQTGLGFLKLCTLGGCGFWSIFDWFTIMSAADTHNMNVLMQLGAAYAALAPPVRTYALGTPPNGY